MALIHPYHQAVLQYLLAVRLASEEQLSAFHADVLRVLRVHDAQALEPTIAALNSQLETCGLRIACILDDEVPHDANANNNNNNNHDDDDGLPAAQLAAPARVTKFFSVINLRADEAAKHGTELKPKELAYFRELVDILVKDLSLSLVGALNAADAVDSFSKAQAEATLARLADERWLHRSAAGDFFLGVRSALELVPYIEQRFGEDALQKCTICHMALLSGIACPTPRCAVRLHNHCAMQWLAARDQSSCIVCQAPWNAALPPHIRKEVDKVRHERLKLRQAPFRGVVLH
jgi:hypothetical protein